MYWRKEHPDGYFLSAGEAPPQRGVDGQWKRAAWGTRHGPAIVHWSSGTPTFVENAVMPDGRLIAASGYAIDGTWRTPVGEQAQAWARVWSGGDVQWVLGSLTLTADQAIFVADRKPWPPTLHFPSRSAAVMAAELLGSENLCARMRDTPLAVAMYITLYCFEWIKVVADESAWYTIDDAGQLLSDMRQYNETYIDFHSLYNCDKDENLDELDRNKKLSVDLLRDIGWHIVSSPR
ncbi:hypothetical protein [Phreatobacter stygius]|uniref:Uncharacterized protein n=1 Tax=Phreatobacter stygius TaxID=1940610 RepID=A0A4D7B0X1_9HYPH|nr:hypothetical protein [Phreatobacter stygius]QCI66401.1 hypothetical protein E8M01_20545 [Phreatobacter stygius]